MVNGTYYRFGKESSEDAPVYRKRAVWGNSEGFARQAVVIKLFKASFLGVGARWYIGILHSIGDPSFIFYMSLNNGNCSVPPAYGWREMAHGKSPPPNCFLTTHDMRQHPAVVRSDSRDVFQPNTKRVIIKDCGLPEFNGIYLMSEYNGNPFYIEKEDSLERGRMKFILLTPVRKERG